MYQFAYGYEPCGPFGVEGDKSVVADVVTTVVGVGVPLLFTVVLIITGFVVGPPIV